MKYLKITVEGKGYFPADMLRYDQCYPADGRSAQTITSTSVSPATVHLICTKEDGPTPDRWRSFGWVVTEPSPWRAA